MPTPSEDCVVQPAQRSRRSSNRASFTSCPPEERREPQVPPIASRVHGSPRADPSAAEHATRQSHSQNELGSRARASEELELDLQPLSPREDESDLPPASTREVESDVQSRASGDSAIDGIAIEKAEHVEDTALLSPPDTSPSPASSPRESANESDVKLVQSLATTGLDGKSEIGDNEDSTAPVYLSYPPLDRERPHPHTHTSFLRPGAKFRGTQTSDRQVYEVQVEIKCVDLIASTLCGYLRIQGLTDDHPTLTTFFEGEIIGSKHLFRTTHPSWNSNEKIDMQHWARFPAWLPIAKSAKASSNFTLKNHLEREHLFMRWKEYFLVPDHKVKSISGASFEGFYYICFDQTKGAVSGIYFHAKSEKYQQLELRHVEDGGCVGAVEFR